MSRIDDALTEVSALELEHVEGGAKPTEAAALIWLAGNAAYGGPFGIALAAGGLFAYGLLH
jgi:hypothetical protein